MQVVSQSVNHFTNWLSPQVFSMFVSGIFFFLSSSFLLKLLKCSPNGYSYFSTTLTLSQEKIISVHSPTINSPMRFFSISAIQPQSPTTFANRILFQTDHYHSCQSMLPYSIPCNTCEMTFDSLDCFRSQVDRGATCTV